MTEADSGFSQELERLEHQQDPKGLLALAWRLNNRISKMQPHEAEGLIQVAWHLKERISELKLDESDDAILLDAYIKGHEVVIVGEDSADFFVYCNKYQQNQFIALVQHVSNRPAIIGKYLVYCLKNDGKLEIRVCNISQAFNTPFSEMTREEVIENFSQIFDDIAVMDGHRMLEEFINYILQVMGFDSYLTEIGSTSILQFSPNLIPSIILLGFSP